VLVVGGERITALWHVPAAGGATDPAARHVPGAQAAGL